MLSTRSLYSDPPPWKNAAANRPTLLVSWWCTGFALAIILVRISGRYIRTERLFREDIVMAYSIIPLLGRIAIVHIVLLYGTNNVQPDGLSAQDIRRREIGSRLVLASRIMYAAFLWIAKFTVSEFLKRLTRQVWRQSYEYVLQFIRWFLAITFIAVVIATLTECQPFDRYWQVLPDPGAKCRQGYAQLITMGTSDVLTDLLLVTFPIPIVLKSHLAAKRKVSLVLLFSLSLILIAITIYRVVEVVHRHSDQQFRSLLASLEMLAAAAVSNALVLGSFVRDRGIKKQRYRYGSVGGGSSLDRAPSGTRPRTLTVQTWGSEADLAGELGMRMTPDLEREQTLPTRPKPALSSTSHTNGSVVQANLQYLGRGSAEYYRRNTQDEVDPNGDVGKPSLSPRETEYVTHRRPSFFDVGGLLDYQITPAPLPPDEGRINGNSPLADNNGPSSLPAAQASVQAPHFPRQGASNKGDTRRKKSGPDPSSFQDVGGLLD